MGLAANEKELGTETARYLNAELKHADVTYADLAKRLEAHGLTKTEAPISNDLSRRTISATFFIGTMAAGEMEGFRSEDL